MTAPPRGVLLVVWDDVYGFDYSAIKELALREPLVDTVDVKAVVADPCPFKVKERTIVGLFPSVNLRCSTSTSLPSRRRISRSRQRSS